MSLEVDPNTMPALPPALAGQVPDDESEGGIAKCPITQEACMLEECAWFNRKSGYCFFTYLCLRL